MATLKELADRTGYSPATISRILSGDPSLSVTAEARRKVLEEAGRLNYTATRSRRGRSPKGAPGWSGGDAHPRSSSWTTLITSILVISSARIAWIGNIPAFRWRAGEEGFLAPEEKLDGVVAIGLFTPAQIDSLAALSPNLVFLDSSPFESRLDSVVLGYELGISLALDHLTELGHTRIGFIGPVYKLDDRRQRALEVRSPAV